MNIFKIYITTTFITVRVTPIIRLKMVEFAGQAYIKVIRDYLYSIIKDNPDITVLELSYKVSAERGLRPTTVRKYLKVMHYSGTIEIIGKEPYQLGSDYRKIKVVEK